MACTPFSDPGSAYSVQYWTVTVLLVLGVRASVQEICDTTVWSEDRDDPGVQDVKGSCSEGRILWHSPSGAIRIALHPDRRPDNSSNRSFEACFLASVHAVTVKLFHDDPRTSLKPLTVLSPGYPRMDSAWCVVSQDGEPIVVYIETDIKVKSVGSELVMVDYENTWMMGATDERQRNDCRPCTEGEILQAVCTSDLVFAGTMADVVHDPGRGESALHLRVSRMIREKRDVFSKHQSKRRPPLVTWHRYPRLNIHTGDDVITAGQDDVTSSPVRIDADPPRSGVLFAPYACAIRKGQGEFMFLGKIRFDKAYLHCAPRMEEFIDLWKRAKRATRVLCSLE